MAALDQQAIEFIIKMVPDAQAKTQLQDFFASLSKDAAASGVSLKNLEQLIKEAGKKAHESVKKQDAGVDALNQHFRQLVTIMKEINGITLQFKELTPEKVVGAKQAVLQIAKQRDALKDLVEEVGEYIDGVRGAIKQEEQWHKKSVEGILRTVSAEKLRLDAITESQAAFNRMAEAIAQRKKKGAELESPLLQNAPEMVKALKEREAREETFTNLFLSYTGKRVAAIQSESNLIQDQIKQVQELVNRRLAEAKSQEEAESRKVRSREQIKATEQFRTEVTRLQKSPDLTVPERQEAVAKAQAEFNRKMQLIESAHSQRMLVISANYGKAKDLLDRQIAEQTVRNAERTNKAIEHASRQVNVFINPDKLNAGLIRLREVFNEFKRGERHISEVGGALLGLVDALGPGIKGLAALSAVLTGVGVVAKKMADATTEDALKLLAMQDATDASAASIKTFQLGIERTGGVSFSLETAFQTLSQRMKETAQDATGPAAQAFSYLGVEVVDTTGKLRKTDEVLVDLANAFNNIEDSVAKTSAQQQLFGLFNPQSIAYTLKHFKDLRAEVKELGLDVEINNKSVNEYIKSQRLLDSANRALAITVTNELGPSLAQLTDVMRSVVLVIKDSIESPVFQAFLALIKSIFSAVAIAIEAIVPIILNLQVVVGTFTLIAVANLKRIATLFKGIGESWRELGVILDAIIVKYRQLRSEVEANALAQSKLGQETAKTEAIQSGAVPGKTAPDSEVAKTGGTATKGGVVRGTLAAAGPFIVMEAVLIAATLAIEHYKDEAEELDKKQRKYKETVDDLNKARKEGIITEEQYRNAVASASISIDEYKDVTKTTIKIQQDAAATQKLIIRSFQEGRGAVQRLTTEIVKLNNELKAFDAEKASRLKQTEQSALTGNFREFLTLEEERRREELNILVEYNGKRLENIKKTIDAEKQLAEREYNTAIDRLRSDKEEKKLTEQQHVIAVQELTGKHQQKVLELEERYHIESLAAQDEQGKKEIEIRKAVFARLERLNQLELDQLKAVQLRREQILNEAASKELISNEKYNEKLFKQKQEELEIRNAQSLGVVSGYRERQGLEQQKDKAKERQGAVEGLLGIKRILKPEYVKELQEESDLIAGHLLDIENQISGSEERLKQLKDFAAREDVQRETKKTGVLNQLNEVARAKELHDFKTYLQTRLLELEKELDSTDQLTAESKEQYKILSNEKIRIQQRLIKNTEEGYIEEARIQAAHEQGRLQGLQATNDEILKEQDNLIKITLEREQLAFEKEQALRKAKIEDIQRNIERETALVQEREAKLALSQTTGKGQGLGDYELTRRRLVEEQAIARDKVRIQEASISKLREERNQLVAQLKARGQIAEAMALEERRSAEMIQAEAELTQLIADENELRRNAPVELAQVQLESAEAEIELMKAQAGLEADRLRSLGDIRAAEELEKRTALEAIDLQIAATQALLEEMRLKNAGTQETIQLETQLINLQRERLGIAKALQGTPNQPQGQSGTTTISGIAGGVQVEDTIEGLQAGIKETTRLAQELLGSAMRGFFDLGAAAIAAGNYMKGAAELNVRLSKKYEEEERKRTEAAIEEAKSRAEKIVAIAKQQAEAEASAYKSLQESLVDIGRSINDAYEADAKSRLNIEKNYQQALKSFADEEAEALRQKQIAENRQRIADEIQFQSDLLAARRTASQQQFQFLVSQAKAEAALRQKTADNFKSLVEAEKSYRDNQLKVQTSRAEYEEALARGDRATASRLKEQMKADTDALNSNLEQLKALQKERENLKKERETNAKVREIETKRRQDIAGLTKDFASGKLSKEEFDARVKAVNEQADLDKQYLQDKLDAQKSNDAELLKEIESAYADQKKALEDQAAAELLIIEKQKAERDRIRDEDKAEEDKARQARLDAINQQYADELEAQKQALAEQLANIAEQQAEIYIRYAQTLEEIRANTESQLDELGLMYDDFFQSLVDGFTNTGTKAKDVAAAIALVMAQLSGQTFKSADDVKKFIDNYKTAAGGTGASSPGGAGSIGGGLGSTTGGGGSGGSSSGIRGTTGGTGGPSTTGGTGSGGTGSGSSGVQPGTGGGGTSGTTPGKGPSTALPPIAWEILRLWLAGKLTEDAAKKELKAKLNDAQYQSALAQMEKLKGIAKANQPPRVGTGTGTGTGTGAPSATGSTGTGTTPVGTGGGTPVGTGSGTATVGTPAGDTPAGGTSQVDLVKKQFEESISKQGDLKDIVGLPLPEFQNEADLFTQAYDKAIRLAKEGKYDESIALLEEFAQRALYNAGELKKKKNKKNESMVEYFEKLAKHFQEMGLKVGQLKADVANAKQVDASTGAGGGKPSGSDKAKGGPEKLDEGKDKSKTADDGSYVGGSESGTITDTSEGDKIVAAILADSSRDTSYKASALDDAFNKGKITKEQHAKAYQQLMQGSTAASTDIKTPPPVPAGMVPEATGGVAAAPAVTGASPVTSQFNPGDIGKAIDAVTKGAEAGGSGLAGAFIKVAKGAADATRRKMETGITKGLGSERFVG